MANVKRSQPGRPAHDISEQVYHYLTKKLEGLITVTEAARRPFIVCDRTGKIFRTAKGKYLEAIYRREHAARLVPWERQTPGYTHARPMFQDRLLPIPPGAARPLNRKPGRPKNKISGACI